MQYTDPDAENQHISAGINRMRLYLSIAFRAGNSLNCKRENPSKLPWCTKQHKAKMPHINQAYSTFSS